MSSVFYGGKMRMMVDQHYNDLMELEEYPLEIPKVYIDAQGEDYYPSILFGWNDDSVAVVRDQRIVVYTCSNYCELLAEDEAGNNIWVDGRIAPYEGCWGGKYLNEDRAAHDYYIVEYDLKTFERKIYKMVLEKTSEFDGRDVDRIMEFYGEEEFCRDFTIRDHKVHRRVGGDNADTQ